MSRVHVTLLSSLLVAILAFPASAQTPPPTDSAAADSAAPKKKSRFGGLMDKAKKVAGNKAVQDAAKGAATGVACTVVPGAAVVSAATGQGPCATSGLIGGLMSGKGVSGVAATAASVAASGAAAKAMGKMGGTTGAAAAGALGAMGGTGGMTSAVGAAAAQAAAARMMPKGGAAAMPNAAAMAAAQAAAARAMGGAGGMPNAAAMAAAQAAAVRAMGGAGGMPDAAAMAAAQAAAVRMMQTGGALPSMGAALGTATAGGKKVETVDFRELKALLPESVHGMKRTNAAGQKSAAMGMQVSSAEGSYSSDDGKSVTLKIADMGSMTGLAGMATYAWALTEVDSESDGGYEKTTKFKGFKALEKYNKQSRSGELSVLVGGRFVVEADGNNIDMDALKSALGNVDLGKLDRMKGQGVK